MPDLPPISLEKLSQRYEVFFVDQFGVLRDDAGPYEGAIEALRYLKASGRTVIILSNSGRSGNFNAERLAKIGFATDSFDHFVTSGDVAYEILSAPSSRIVEGSRCLTISSGGDRNLADRLGLLSTDKGEEADFVIISGSEAEHISADEYRDMLRPAAERRVPCFCTNPDFHKLHQGSIVLGAGSIAKLFEEMSGSVTWLGKPFPEIYQHALRISGASDKSGVICVGDSIEHDILGASNAGLDSVLVRTGILASATERDLERLFVEVNARADYIMARFSL